jgi:autotransporter strand-loop-strand O-heptosyltransferase
VKNPYLNLNKFRKIINDESPLDISVSFIDTPKVEIFGGKKDEWYSVMFTDKATNERQHLSNIQQNHWTCTYRSYFTDWLIEVYNSTDKIFEHRLNLKNQVVYIALDSKALGDSIAWFPYVDEFRKKHSCKIICSTFHNYLFESEYPEIKFVNPGYPVNGIYAMYKVGWFGPEHNKHRNITDCRNIPLQRIASEYLGLSNTEVKPRIKKFQSVSKTKSITIGPSSTTQAKYWNNPNGWQEVVNHYASKGYIINILDTHDTKLKNVKQLNKDQRNIDNCIKLIQESDVFVGLGSGLSWVAWALNTPVVMISGFSKSWCEFKNPYRIVKEDVCNGCFNNDKYWFDKGDWNWCPAQKNFECTKSISSNEVIKMIDKALLESSYINIV